MICKNILKINLGNIKYNYHYLSNIVSSRVSAVLKANAYGLGMIEISQILVLEGCRDFFTSTFDEALSLRHSHKQQDINIYVLNGLFEKEMEESMIHNIVPVINHLDQLKIYNDFAKKHSKILPMILHFDTGMNRLGMEEAEVLELVNNKHLISNVKISYIMSHLSISEDKENPRNIDQRNRFLEYIRYFPSTKLSLANSSGIFLGKEYHFDMVRSGASLYGINPYQGKPNPMKNPVSLHSYILQLRDVKKGQYVGYSNGFFSDRDIKVATIPIGYADGYKRVDNSKAYVIIGGEKAKVIGNVSMDLTTIDVTHISDEKLYLGAKVEVIGPSIHHDILGLMQNTIGYEVLTSLGNRYMREYVNE
jgi:alanine racemase